MNVDYDRYVAELKAKWASFTMEVEEGKKGRQAANVVFLFTRHQTKDVEN